MEYIIHPTCQIPTLDNIYHEVFKNRDTGYFVEVGAFDGMTYSNTWGLAQMGWGGLYVEAHPDFANQCIHNHRHHPKIDTMAVACGEKAGEGMLTIYGEVSTLKPESKWNRDWGMNDQTPKIKVPILPLEDILFMHHIEKFDLLVIDVEEMEHSVLKGFNIHAHLPKMIIIELHEGQGTRMDQKGWQEPWVTSYLKGYNKIYVDTINTIYELAE